MKRRLGIIVIMVLAMALAGVNGCAITLTLPEGGEPLTATRLNGGEKTVEASEVELLGVEKGESDAYLIYADKQILKATQDALMSATDDLSVSILEALPDVADYETMARHDKGEKVVDLQKKLIELEYLSGSADGDFGGMTENSVSRFQEAMGLSATGEADAYTQLLLNALTGEPVQPVVTVGLSEDRFESIIAKTDVDLTATLEKGLELEFDDIAGTGLITNGNRIEYTVVSEADIDQCSFTGRFGLQVVQGADGVVNVDPVLVLEALSVRRPIMQEITLKSGDERYTLPVTSLTSAISGIQSRETAVVVLSEEALNMLANVKGEGELKVRVSCKYDSYDFSAPSPTLAAISDVAVAAQGL